MGYIPGKPYLSKDNILWIRRGFHMCIDKVEIAYFTRFGMCYSYLKLQKS